MADGNRTGAFLIVGAIVCLSTAQFVFAQEVDPRCKDIYDKVACTCAVGNAGHVIPPPVGVKREGLKLRPKEAAGGTQTLDGGRLGVPKDYRRKALKYCPTNSVERSL